MAPLCQGPREGRRGGLWADCPDVHRRGETHASVRLLSFESPHPAQTAGCTETWNCLYGA